MACPSLFSRISGAGFYQTKNVIPQPNVTILFDASSFSFVFSVNATFFDKKQDTTWVIDFAPFDFRSRSLNTPNNCENRKAESYMGVPIAKYWKSANHSMEEGALGSTNYLAFGPANGWNMMPNQCSGVVYSRAFTFGQLLQCKGSDSRTVIASQSWSQTNMFSYKGTLYATSVSAIWKNSSKSDINGYETIEYAYPFEFKFGSLVNDVVAVSTTNNFNLRVVSMKLNNENKLVISLRTDLASTTGDFLFMEQIAASPFGVLLAENVTGLDASLLNANGKRIKCAMTGDKCFQEWTLVSYEVQASYNGKFNLLWGIAPCTNGQCDIENSSPNTVTGSFAVTMDVVEQKVGQFDFQTKLSTFKSETMQKEFAGPYRAGDRVYVRDQLSVQPSDVEKFSIRVANAWICFPDDSNFIPKYDPSQNMFGCSKEVVGKLSGSNIVQLVQNRQATSATDIQSSLQISLHASRSLAALPHSTTVAFSFLAQALSFQDAIYYIHVETEIIQGGTTTRMSHSITQQSKPVYGAPGSQIELNALYLEGKTALVTATTKEPSAAPLLWFAFVSGSAGLVGMCCCIAGSVMFVIGIFVRKFFF